MADGYFEVDIDDLTLDEIELVEEVIDGPFDEAFEKGKRKAPAMKALALVVLRREVPGATVEDVGKLKIRITDSSNPPEPGDADSA